MATILLLFYLSWYTLIGILSTECRGVSFYEEIYCGVQLVYEEIADAQIFVLPSNYEGLSNALLEAMMMGLPCIATNCSGCDEVIESGKNGILIPVRGRNELEEKLFMLVQDPGYAQVLGENAKESSESFRVQNVIALWRKVIEG